MSGRSRRARRAKAGCVRREPVFGPLGQTGVAKNKYADPRGQIALFARLVDLSDQCRQRHMLGMRYFFQGSPEGLFNADASLVSTNYDGTFNDRGFHWSPRTPPARYHLDQIRPRDGGTWMRFQAGTLFT